MNTKVYKDKSNETNKLNDKWVNRRELKPLNKYWLFEMPINYQIQLLCCQNNKFMTLFIE